MSTQPRRDGIDVYEGNNVTDWNAVRASTAGWAAIKATQYRIDNRFIEYRRAIAAAGFTHRLLYHWLVPDQPVDAQVTRFVAATGPLAAGEGVMLDAEQDGITVAEVAAWCAAVERFTGRPVVVYTGAFVAGGDIARWAQSTSRPLIIAGYIPREQLSSVLTQQRIGTPDGWQWAGDTSAYGGPGQCPGVVGAVDCDEIGNWAAFDRACGIQPAPPLAPTPDIPTSDTSEEDDMPLCFFTTDPAGVVWIVARDLSSKTKVTDLATLDELGKHGEVPMLTLTAAQHAQIPAVKP